MIRSVTNHESLRDTQHLTEEQLEALLDAAPISNRAAAHLAECAACQHQLALAAQSDLELTLAARTFPLFEQRTPRALDAGCDLDDEPEECSGVRSIAGVSPWYRRRWPRFSNHAVPGNLQQLACCLATVIVLGGSGILSFWTQPMRGGMPPQHEVGLWLNAGCHPSQSWCADVPRQ